MADDKKLQIQVSTVADLKGVQQTDAALTDLTKSVKTYTKEEVESATKAVEASQRTTNAKRQLKDALKGLSLEVPLLGQAWEFVSNPITASISGIIAGIQIWRYRMKELTATFGETEIATVKITNRERVNAMAEEWNKFDEALGKISEKYTSLEAQQGRMLDGLKQQADLMRQLAGDLNPSDKAALDESIARDQAYGQSKAGMAFGVSARNKEAEARRLTEELNRTNAGLDPKKRAEMKAALKAEAAAANSDMALGRERLGFLDEAENASWWNQGTNWKYSWIYGDMSIKDARALEQNRIARAQERLDSTGRRVEHLETGGTPGQRIRSRITSLLEGAAADRAKEAEFNNQAVGTQSSADLAAGLQRMKAGLPLTVSPTGAGISISPENLAKLIESNRMLNAALMEMDRQNRATAARLNTQR